MKTGQLRKSIENIDELKFPNPKDMPRTGTGKAYIEQGSRIDHAVKHSFQKYREEIEQQLLNKIR